MQILKQIISSLNLSPSFIFVLTVTCVSFYILMKVRDKFIYLVKEINYLTMKAKEVNTERANFDNKIRCLEATIKEVEHSIDMLEEQRKHLATKEDLYEMKDVIIKDIAKLFRSIT